MRNILFLLLAPLFACHSDHEITKDSITEKPDLKTFPIYSVAVKDTFMVSVYLPDILAAEQQAKLPVIYVLDANLYFEIYASVIKKYSEVGLLPPAILVGIGYSSFQKMDSLRQRDYTFPDAIPEYEMPVSGKANRFMDFLQNELIPVIDQKYPSDTANRIITGHSLGGYFTMYTLLQELKNKENLFAGYIAVSPSLDFNHNYLLHQFDSTGNLATSKKKLYVGYGGLENADPLFHNLPAKFSKFERISVKTASYSELDHMDTQIPGFIKGLQWLTAE